MAELEHSFGQMQKLRRLGRSVGLSTLGVLYELAHQVAGDRSPRPLLPRKVDPVGSFASTRTTSELKHT
jgi:hypothetical protein